MTVSAPTWQLQENIASVQLPFLTGSIDVQEPQQGILLTSLLQREMHLRWHGLQIPTQPQSIHLDSFARVNDLVAHYAETPQTRLRTELVWRIVECEPQIVYVEQIISAQTSFLDSDPGVKTTFSMPSGEWLHWSATDGSTSELDSSRPAAYQFAAGAVLLRSQDVSFALITRATDTSGLQIEQVGGGSLATLDLFGGRIEKGVIRRGQVGILACNGDDDLAILQSVHSRFAAAPPPLN